ncbi:unnamed protein product [Malus baccata var. baccata]
MARGLKKHLKRLNAPKHWMLDKLGGAFVRVISILMQRHVLVDGKVRTDKIYPSGFMGMFILSFSSSNSFLILLARLNFRLLYDTKGRFLRSVQANDTIKLDLETNKITDFVKFNVGNVVMVTGGRNRGGGSFETIHVQDATGHEFATRLGNVFTIGKGERPWVSLLPKGKGIKLTIIEEAKKRQAAQQAATA